jgi:membrane-bound serine protease (ClpP class)
MIRGLQMTLLGLVLLLVGTTFVVAEAHAPSGALGVGGSVALVAGAIIAITALGGDAVLAIPVGIALGAVACGWALMVTRSASRSRGTRIQAGAEALCGRVGVVRRWSESAGQVFIDGALWRARHEWLGDDEESFHEGESVVVERVNGLTLSVRRAEEWELIG